MPAADTPAVPEFCARARTAVYAGYQPIGHHRPIGRCNPAWRRAQTDLRFTASWTTISSSYRVVVLPQVVIQSVCLMTGGRG